MIQHKCRPTLPKSTAQVCCTFELTGLNLIKYIKWEISDGIWWDTSWDARLELSVPISDFTTAEYGMKIWIMVHSLGEAHESMRQRERVAHCKVSNAPGPGRSEVGVFRSTLWTWQGVRLENPNFHKGGFSQDLNPGPLAPKENAILLDQQALSLKMCNGWLLQYSSFSRSRSAGLIGLGHDSPTSGPNLARGWFYLPPPPSLLSKLLLLHFFF